MSEFFKIDPRLESLAQRALADCEKPFARIAEIERYNSEKVLRAFIDNRVSESLFAGSSAAMMTAGVRFLTGSGARFSARRIQWFATIL